MFATEGARKFFEAWANLRTGNELPHYRDLFSKLSPKIVPSLFIVEETSDGKYPIRFMGTHRVDSWGEDLTQTNSLDALSENASKVAAKNLKMILDHPCGIRGVAVAVSPGERELTVEYVVLPTSVDPGKPRRLVSHNTENETGLFARSLGKIAHLHPRTWIDIGFDIPSIPPFK